MGVSTFDSANIDLNDLAPLSTVLNPPTDAELQAEKAHNALKRIWAIKAVVDAILTLGLVGILSSAVIGVDTVMVPALIAACIGLWVIQLVAVFGMYTRKPWSLWVLHVFSLVSCLQIPFGTVLAIMHFIKVRHVDFAY